MATWHKKLRAFDDFFDLAGYKKINEQEAQQEIVKNYYALEKLFAYFYLDYGTILKNMDHLLVEKPNFNNHTSEKKPNQSDKEKAFFLKNKQPIKAVTYQDIFTVVETVEQLESWIEPLYGLSTFFLIEQGQLNKKRVVREFSANSQIFQLFLKNYNEKLAKLGEQLDELKERVKVRI